MTVREIKSLPKNKSLEQQHRDLLELREEVQKAVAKSIAPSLSEPRRPKQRLSCARRRNVNQSQ
jgi:ribosomal protein L18E